MKKVLGVGIIIMVLCLTSAMAIGPSSKVYYSFYEPDISKLENVLGEGFSLDQKFNVGMQYEMGLAKGFALAASGSVYLGKGSGTYEEDLGGIFGTVEFPLNHEIWIFPVDVMLKYRFFKFAMGNAYGMAGWSWTYALYRMEIGGAYATMVTSGLNSRIARGWDNSGFVIGAGVEMKLGIVSGFAEIVNRNGNIDSIRYFDTGLSEYDGQLLQDENGNNATIDLKGVEYRIGISFGF